MFTFTPKSFYSVLKYYKNERLNGTDFSVKRRLLHLSFFPAFLLVLLLVLSVASPHYTSAADWSERKLGKIILKADKAARKKKWTRAIKYGERMLEGSAALDKKSDARYINQLKTLNGFYDKAGRLKDIGPRAQTAYLLASKHLGLAHSTTVASRLLYYKILISQKNYPDAIPLVEENISILKEGKAEDFRRLHYLEQLYSLYGITGQLEKEQGILLRLLALNEKLFDNDAEYTRKIILNLSKTYCYQNKMVEFNQLMKTYGLKYKC